MIRNSAATSTLKVHADVVIIGAGVVGCSIAERLSHEDVSVVVLERRHDVADETSKSNTGIASCGWLYEAGSLEAKLAVRSAVDWEDRCDRLDVPYRRSGKIAVALSEEEESYIPALLAQAKGSGVAVEPLRADEVREMEPEVNPESRAGIYSGGDGVIDPVRLTVGYATLAAINGVRFFFNAPVTGADLEDERITTVHAVGVSVSARFVVNAAGLGADSVSEILGAESFWVRPRRGQWLLADRATARVPKRIIMGMPTKTSAGAMVTPSTHRSILLGPTAEDDDDKYDRSTSAEVSRKVLGRCAELVPSMREASIIKHFTGLRPNSERLYRIEGSAEVENVIHACGIRSSGISTSPAVGEYVVELLKERGLKANPRLGAVDRIPKTPRLSEDFDGEAVACEQFGRTVVCACEKVTALEVHRAMSSALPAQSVAGVAKRTRATWGRCQGSACMSGVTFIASLHLGCDAWAVPMGEPGGTIGVARAKT